MKDLNLDLFRITQDPRVFGLNSKKITQIIIERVVRDKNGLISDEFMNLMAKHLHKFHDRYFDAWVLFSEIAMQRISLGSMPNANIKHSDITLNYFLPNYFNKKERGKAYNFTKMAETPTPFNDACLNFLLKQGIFILNEPSHQMKEILFFIINDHIDEEGKYQSFIIDKNINHITLINFAKKSLYDYLPVNVVIDHIANKNIWHKHLPYIQENWHFIDKTKFAKAIGLKVPFKKTRLFLKILPIKLL